MKKVDAGGHGRLGWLFAACALLLPVAAAQAAGEGACDRRQLDAVARHLGGEADGDPVAAACKAWPADPAITLAAAVWSRSPADASPGGRRLDLDVAMLDASGKVLAAHRRPMEEDALLALTEDALRLDTARYDLAPGRRAFGVVVSSSAPGPSCPERGFEDELTLYLRDGGTLAPVLSTYLRAWDFVAGSPCDHDAPLVTDSADITLHLEPTRSRGLADIRLQAAVSRERGDGQGGSRTLERRTADRRLRFDGTSYQADPYDHLFFWAEEGRRD